MSIDQGLKTILRAFFLLNAIGWIPTIFSYGSIGIGEVIPLLFQKGNLPTFLWYGAHAVIGLILVFSWLCALSFKTWAYKFLLISYAGGQIAYSLLYYGPFQSYHFGSTLIRLAPQMSPGNTAINAGTFLLKTVVVLFLLSRPSVKVQFQRNTGAP